MARERKIVGLWPGGSDPAAAEFGDVGQRSTVGQAPDDNEPASSPPQLDPPLWLSDDDRIDLPRRTFPFAAIGLSLVAAGWLGFYGWTISNGFRRLPLAPDIPAMVATAIAPLVFLLVLVLVFQRGSARSVERHLRLLAAMRSAHDRLSDQLVAIDRQWQDAQSQLLSQAKALSGATYEASRQIDAAGAIILERMQETVRGAEQVAQQGETARRHMDGLVLALPKVDEVARRTAENLRQAGQTAYQFGGQLEAKIADIQNEASEAERKLSIAHSTLAARIDALQAATRDGEAAVAAAVEQFSALLESNRDAALAMLAELAAGMDQSVTDTEERLRSARSTFETDALRGFDALEHAVSQAEVKAGALDALVASAVMRSAELGGTLARTADQVGERFTTLEQQTGTRLAALGDAVNALARELDGFESAAGAGIARAADLSAKATDAIAALQAVGQTLDNELPDALARLQVHVAASRQAIETLPPMISATEAGTQGALDRLQAAETLLEQHAQTLTAVDRMASAALTSQADLIGALQGRVDTLVERLAAVKDAGQPLEASLANVELLAGQTADRTKATLAAVLTESVAELETSISAALDRAANETVEARIGSVGAAAERAVSAATSASERLMRQLITISESSAALEARARDVSEAVAEGDRDSLARQLSLMSESLQSTAVDLTKLLSHDVADQAWEAYLKGDRGIFARRAVRLLNSAEARELLKRYQDDEAFRAQVNRYIHDFEAMLRALMSSRDGSALSVTLLSSDIGKVYVALAQAIERLRS